MLEIKTESDTTEMIVTKDDRYERPANMTPEQRATYESLIRMGLNPHDYYNFETNEILDFPPPRQEFVNKLKRLQAKTDRHLDDLESSLGIDVRD